MWLNQWLVVWAPYPLMVFGPKSSERVRFWRDWGTTGSWFGCDCACDFGLEQEDFAVAGAGVLQSAEFAAEALEMFRAFGGVGYSGEAFEFFGEFEGELLFGEGGDAAGALGGVAFGALVGEFAEAVATFLLPQPVLKAAVAPLGEVVFGDGTASEAMGEDAPDFRQGVQPGNEFTAEGAVVQALV